MGKKSNSKQYEVQSTEQGIYAQPPVDPEANPRGSLGFQFLSSQDALLGECIRYEDLKEVTVQGEGLIELSFRSNLKWITLKITCNTAQERDELLANIERYSLKKPFIHGYDPTITSAFEHAKHVCAHGSIGEKIGVLPHILVDLMLKTTLFPVDVKDMRKEGRWDLRFVGAMAWLAIFSYGMLEIAEQIHCNIPVIPNAFLGITVCAVGTSFA